MDIVGYVASVLGIITSALAFLTAFFSFKSWMKGREIRKEQQHEKERMSRRVTVKLQYGAQEIELPVEMRRAEFTRAELLGRLGMIPLKNKGGRFSLGYLNKPDFLRRLNEIQTADGDTLLVIPCNEEEFAQFDVKG